MRAVISGNVHKSHRCRAMYEELQVLNQLCSADQQPDVRRKPASCRCTARGRVDRSHPIPVVGTRCDKQTSAVDSFEKIREGKRALRKRKGGERVQAIYYKGT